MDPPPPDQPPPATAPAAAAAYEEALNCLSSLITRRTRADGTNKGDQFDIVFDYLKVDVAILEVGLGGKFDATNAVQEPIVCGISSLGYDHMEILGNTLREIAGEKAGIFKQGVPAYTVPQPEEAMSALKNKASHLGISLQVASPLGRELLKSQQLGLHGDHQFLNAGLAVALSSTWLQRTGYAERFLANNSTTLPEQFARGLTMANLQGRAQVIPDTHVNMQNPTFGGLIFYLDGAHSPESLEVCARWFSHVIKEETQLADTLEEPHNICKSKQILLFNCMSVRDPHLLLPPFVNSFAHLGIYFDKAIFVPNQSVYNKVGSHSVPQTDLQEVDLSWQLTLQKVWESLIHQDKGLGNDKIIDSDEGKKHEELGSGGYECSFVFPSLPLAIKWLRENAQQNQSVRFQVLVTGSLHLVGDVLKLLKR